MIYKPDTILKEINKFLTLENNDIIMSGTPKGVGNYQKGDIFEAKIYENKKEILNAKWVVE
jgi:2-keto-4-pentenoate hydratase/2-oxohepta-3-ene-1,7-dioic acid hydratase in catechol pathway